MRTTLYIQDQLLIQAKKIAAETHRTLTSVVEDALRMALEKQSRRKSAKPFRLRTFKGEGPRPGVDINCTVALEDFLDMEKHGHPRR